MAVDSEQCERERGIMGLLGSQRGKIGALSATLFLGHAIAVTTSLLA